MNIPVDDSYLFNLRIVVLCIAGGDSDVVKETKPHGPFRCRVVAGWTHGNKGVVGLPRHHQIDCLAWRASGISGSVERVHGNGGIGIQISGSFPHDTFDGFIELWRMARL